MFQTLFQKTSSCLFCHNFVTHTDCSLCSGCLNDLQHLYALPHQQIQTPNAIWTHEWHSAHYLPPLPTALHYWKHGKQSAFAHLFQKMMLDNPPIWLPKVQIDGILPMPISHKRRLERGFNQCDELVHAIAAQYDLPILPQRAVSRQHKAAQSTLNKAQRLENIQNSFTINHHIHNQNLLLIDDICTTGATLGELTRSLKAAGTRQIFVWVAARKPHVR